jgi:hypothetical protein
MRVGTDMDRIISAIQDREIKSLAITMANGSLGLASVDAARAEAEVLNRTAVTMHLADSILARTVVWPGHYHPVMENLANVQHVFRGFAQ